MTRALDAAGDRDTRALACEELRAALQKIVSERGKNRARLPTDLSIAISNAAVLLERIATQTKA